MMIDNGAADFRRVATINSATFGRDEVSADFGYHASEVMASDKKCCDWAPRSGRMYGRWQKRLLVLGADVWNP